MRALILAGGMGKRLGELTKSTPKPLIEVAGKPIIEHIIDNLNLHGVYDIIINTHYLATQINKRLETRALYYHVNKLLGHKGTIFALKNWLKDEDFLVINGDTLTTLNYTEMMNIHKPKTITMYMDSEWRGGGTWIYSKDVFKNELPVIPYRPHADFYDTGTPEKLEKAREVYK